MSKDEKAYITFAREKAYYDGINFKNYLKRVEEESSNNVKKRVASALLDILDNETISMVTGISIGQIKVYRDERM